MTLTIESTTEGTLINGVPVRVWKGRTAGGVECVVFVACIAVEVGKDAEFDRELVDIAEPGTEVARA